MGWGEGECAQRGSCGGPAGVSESYCICGLGRTVQPSPLPTVQYINYDPYVMPVNNYQWTVSGSCQYSLLLI